MTHNLNERFEYDAALSFATEDKVVAEELAELFTNRNIKVFLDEYTGSEPWGKDILDHLVNLYSRKARYCVLLISEHYPLTAWTKTERASVQDRSFRDASEYILPIQLDDVNVPGIVEATGYVDLRRVDKQTMEKIARFLEQELAGVRERSGPPPQSHDLRSGNVPTENT
jgi:hypothetical protein